MDAHKRVVLANVSRHYGKHCDKHGGAKEEQQESVVIKEVRYKTNEKIEFTHDVFSLTVAANLNNVGHREYFFCLRQCVYVFIFQLAIVVYFAYDYLDFDLFRTSDWNEMNLCMRVLCSVMLQRYLNMELEGSISLMAYLISMKVTAENRR